MIICMCNKTESFYLMGILVMIVLNLIKFYIHLNAAGWLD